MDGIHAVFCWHLAKFYRIRRQAQRINLNIPARPGTFVSNTRYKDRQPSPVFLDFLLDSRCPVGSRFVSDKEKKK